jgi:probable phosphoglycerate mutase
MAPKRTIYLLRHGETEQEGDRRLIGQLDVPLNETGFRQARWWRQELSSVSFERCCCSDLLRSLQTADTLAGLCRGPVEVLPPLREIHLGEWQGLSTAEIQSRFPGEWERRGKDFVSFRPRGGESFSDLVDRAIPVFEQILDRLTGKTLIVAHAGVNRVILCRVLGMPLANLFRLGQGFGALNIIDCSQAGAQLSALNQLPPVTQ